MGYALGSQSTLSMPILLINKIRLGAWSCTMLSYTQIYRGIATSMNLAIPPTHIALTVCNHTKEN